MRTRIAVKVIEQEFLTSRRVPFARLAKAMRTLLRYARKVTALQVRMAEWWRATCQARGQHV